MVERVPLPASSLRPASPGWGRFARVLPVGLALLINACGSANQAEPEQTRGTPFTAPTSAPAASAIVSASPIPTSRPSPPPVQVPLVPIAAFWSSERAVTSADLRSIVAGTDDQSRSLLVAEGELAGLVEALRVKPGRDVQEVTASDMPALLAGDRRLIGLVRPEDVTLDVRALTLDGVALFGVDRVRRLDDWPLLIASRAAPSSFDPASSWTLVAGGDVMLDRDVYRLAVQEGRGADFPWDGGTARITDRFCCGWPGEEIVVGTRTGHAGAVRDLLGGGDVAVVNLEGPAPDDFSYHPSGFVFTMDPALLDGLDRAGIDVVSLANNHILNAGARGLADTVRNLDRLEVLHAGAGRNLAAARRPALVQAAGLRIAVLAYDAVASEHHATRSRAGSAPLRLSVVRADISAARADGADVVVVVPHWGREYTDRITPQQDELARDLVDAGADLVLGAHSHWAGPLEIIDGRLVVYSMGDLVFDLRHDERTQQGIVVELTFVGRRLAQVELHPTVIVEDAQPNLLEPAGGGTALLRAIEKASNRLAD